MLSPYEETYFCVVDWKLGMVIEIY